MRKAERDLMVGLVKSALTAMAAVEVYIERVDCVKYDGKAAMEARMALCGLKSTYDAFRELEVDDAQ